MSEIVLDRWGCCLAVCKFQKECAQHYSAGDFRSEDGFSPEIEVKNGQVHCNTFGRNYITNMEKSGPFDLPENYNQLERGFIPKSELNWDFSFYESEH